MNENEKHKIFKIGVISGKGGVGKTTLSGSLALIAKNSGFNIVVADCDVDAPNLGLIFKGGNVINRFGIRTTEKAFFHIDECTHCRSCVNEQFCEFHALSWDDEENIPIIDQLSCEGCGACRALCPSKAFEIQAVDSGMMIHEMSPYGFPLIWGETRLGATTSGKLVTEIKKYVEKIAEKENAELIIIDGPPGIGCPVVATVSGLDFVIVVTEPTSTALHDAKRAIEVLNQMKISYGVVINKADAWSEGKKIIMEYISATSTEFFGEIPIDNSIPNSTVKGIPVYQYNPDCPSSLSIKAIFSKLSSQILDHH